jgi:hypothetical protein
MAGALSILVGRSNIYKIHLGLLIMNWKEFLKPTSKKIILALLIFFFVIGFFDLTGCLGGRNCPDGTVNYKYAFQCHFSSDCISQSQANYLNLTQRGPLYLGILIISYFLSCLVFIKRNKNRV